MLEAAARLFAERGFESATIAAIAEQAGVSPETVYAGFRNKRTLLGELIRAAVRGGEASPVPEQAGPRAVAAAVDQREQLRLFAADISLRLERVGPLVEVLSTASRTDPELAALLAKIHDERLPRTCARSCTRWPPTGRCASSRKPLSTRSGPSQARTCTAC